MYIFLYNVVQIKSNFMKLKHACRNKKFVLIASSYCIEALTPENLSCFDAIYEIPRNFHHIDYATVEKIVKNYVKEYGAENIKIMTNEDSAQLTCARIHEQYNIPGFKVAEILPFVNKTISKKLLDNVVKKPQFLLFDKIKYTKEKATYLNEIVNILGFPMFIKPIDLVSSLHTYKIDDFTTLQEVTGEILNYKYDFEIDEFIHGDLFHCDMIINNCELKFFMVAQYAYPLALFSKGATFGSIPVTDKKLFNRFYAFSKKIIQRLNCKNGCYHLEVFLNKNDELVFVEIAARTPGALIPMMYEIQFGFNIEEWHYLAHMGLFDDKQTINQTDKFVAWITYPKQDGVILNFKKPKLDIAHKFIEHVSINENMTSAESLLDVACSIVFWDISLQKTHQTFETLKKYQPIKLKKMTNQINQPNNYLSVVDELFNAMPHIFWKNKAGVYLGCNLNQAKAFNYTIEEYIGKTAFELFEKETAQRITKIDELIMKKGNPVTVEEAFLTPQGEEKIYLSQKMPRYNNKGEIIGLLGFAMDITEIRQQEALAKTQAETLIKEKHDLEINNYKDLTKQQEVFKKCLDEIQHTIQNYKINILNKKLGVITQHEELELNNIKLTKREQDILYYLSLNKSPKDIAAIITILENKKISDSTINAVINKQLYPKFDVFNIGQLIEKANAFKLIPFMPDNL